MGVLSWVVLSVLVVFIHWSRIACLSCSLTRNLSRRSSATRANCSSLHALHSLHVFSSICDLYPWRHRQDGAGVLMTWESVKKSIDFGSTDGSSRVQNSSIRVLQVVHSG